MNVTTTCANLQTELNNADTNAQGGFANTYTITLQGTCTGQYQLPNFPSPGAGEYKVVTLKGNPADGPDGFDPAAPGRPLTGTNVNRFELQNLTFRNGTHGGNGGAVAIAGESSLGVRFSTFLNNHATGNGGALYFSQSFPAAALPIPGSLNIQESTFGSLTDAALGNSADANGGAVSVEAPGVGASSSGINGSLFAKNVAKGNGGGFDWIIAGADNLSLNNNRFSANKAGGSGGGGHVKIANASFLNIGGELYDGNSVEPISGNGPTPDHFGGGLYIENGGSNPRLRQNQFTGNSVKAFANGTDYGGGGAAIINTKPPAQLNPPTTLSELDRFTQNTVAGQPDLSADESEGGGLYFAGADSVFNARLAVLAGNSIGPNGEGGGAYAGAAVGGTLLEFHDSTVAGNTVGAGGEAAGLAGNGDDQLKLRNSIVWNGPPKPDIDGFAQTDIAYSDACQGVNGVVPSGAGNICVDPLLANAPAGNIHQTGAGPTVDKGNDAAFFEVAGEGPFTDFEGDPRPTDGDGDGHTTDMGADEGPAFVRPVKPFVPGTVTTSGTKPQCADARDNDGDGAVDSQDPGCSTAADADEGDESVRDLVLCGRRTISLVRADVRGGRVRLSGLVASRVARRPVTILANYGGKAKGSAFTKRATVRANSRGQFSASVAPPPKRLFTKARFQARVGGSRSASLKLPQSLASSSIRKSGSSIVIRGQVDRGVLGKRNAVVIQRLVCGRLRTVGSAKPDRRGRYVVRFKAPALGTAALYRATGRVLARPGSKRYVRQFARAVGITLTGQSG
ncbi:MAG TPA: hypothetical protein VEX39_12235 [Thermoleophilaceae bacterium]|nr:hypothetical protein [Thermoleophilaceae bacterium]